MPTALVLFPDGSEWLVSPWEIIIPARQAGHLSTAEIGERVLDLLPRLHKLARHVNKWDDAPTTHHYLSTLEDIEAHVAAIEEEEAARAHARLTSSLVRKDIQANYDHIFMALGRRDGFDCRRCGVSIDLEIDHIVAMINGGSNDFDNLQLLCKSCNGKKSDKG